MDFRFWLKVWVALDGVRMGLLASGSGEPEAPEM
jgi:hypothetical protein